MPYQESSESEFDRRLYERASVDFIALKSRLPEAAIESLAREVCARLSRVTEVSPAVHQPDAGEIETLCRALVSDDKGAGARMIERARRDGASFEMVYVGYLGRAAQRLGEWWDDDLASFAEVTIGTSRIYAIMRAMRALVGSTLPVGTKSAIFASVPGETHTLGVSMAADLFRQRGWQVDLKVGMDHDTLIEELAVSDQKIVGLSGSGSNSVHALARLVVALRMIKPDALIMVSGHIVATDDDTLNLLGIDGCAIDFPGALAEMDRLLVQAALPARRD